jgi:hypothetical protein
MDMITHNGKVPNFEWELLFGENNYVEKQLLDDRVFQRHIPMVNFGGHVIDGPGL